MNSAMITVRTHGFSESLTLYLAIIYRSAPGTGTQVTGGSPRNLLSKFAFDGFHARGRRELEEAVANLPILLRICKTKLGRSSIDLGQDDTGQLAGRRYLK